MVLAGVPTKLRCMKSKLQGEWSVIVLKISALLGNIVSLMFCIWKREMIDNLFE